MAKIREKFFHNLELFTIILTLYIQYYKNWPISLKVIETSPKQRAIDVISVQLQFF